jgi:hypothetical protein
MSLIYKLFSFDYSKNSILPTKGKNKAIPLQAWTGLGSSRRLKLIDFKTIGT